MNTSSTFAQVAGSALAGAVGFFMGFYVGFFIVLSIFGLAAGELSFVLFTGGLGTLAAGGAIAFTVSSSRRWVAFMTSVVLGLVLMSLVFVFDADAAAMGVGGLLVVVATSAIVRTGMADAIVN